MTEDVTVLLAAWSRGDRGALDRLMPMVYDELRFLARRHLARERRDHTLQTTALVHEAYVKLVDQRNPDWKSRSHFFAVAAELMRRILVDHARARAAAKRGGGAIKQPLEQVADPGSLPDPDLLNLDLALQRLGEIDPRQVRVVELRYFGGLSIDEAAEVLGLSAATVKREWSMARAWLYRELSSEREDRSAY